ncbi:hypothetical protein [Geopsychrobacter electrodiphilus]|uniref:hypothetical protein n=1 Tax=Geopsychrobacter electrodiphilus TaxID=225196 RepID=UPI00037381DB|nr:hypothetical protein [Geopsychrobacter electrodiphilus]
MDIWGTLKEVVKKGAPILAGAIVPGSGGLAASLISSIFGTDPNDPQAMLDAVKGASPEQWVAIQKAQMQHQTELAQISAELDKAYLGDRQDARERDEKMRASGYQNKRADLMIVGDVVGLLACLGAMLYITWLGVHGGANGQANPIIMAINGPLGMLTQQFANGLRDAHQFEFGSSRGSKEKDAKMVKG